MSSVCQNCLKIALLVFEWKKREQHSAVGHRNLVLNSKVRELLLIWGGEGSQCLFLEQ